MLCSSLSNSCSLEITCPNSLILTPFYRTIVQVGGGCAPEPDINYLPYDLFCLHTKLYPYILDKFGSDIIISFQSLAIDERYVVTILLLKDDNPITMTEEEHTNLQKHINYLITYQPLVCLMFYSHSPLYLENGFRLPTNWISSMLPYVILPSKLNAFVNNDSLFATLQPKENKFTISLDTINGTPTGNYLDLYGAMVLDVQEQLRKLYQLGYIMYASPIANDWQLNPVDDDGLVYKPDWSDRRLTTDLVQFLTSKLHGNNWIDINISDNLVIRHQVAKKLNNFTIKFFGCYLKVEVFNLFSARQVASLALSVSQLAIGEVITFRLRYSTDINKYYPSLEKYKITDYIMYQTEQKDFPYILSILLPFGTNKCKIEELVKI